jgi:hypothetical protein
MSTYLQIENELRDDRFFHQSNRTATPSSSCKSCPQSITIPANFYKFFQLWAARYQQQKKQVQSAKQKEAAMQGLW